MTGTPVITLNTTPIRTGIYVSGSGETTLLFQYTVIDGDTSTGLDYASTTALALDGGTIQNGSGEDATLTLANPGDEHSLGYNTDIVIDTTKPTCTFDYNPTSGTVVNTDVIATCTPSEPVTYQQPLGTGVYTFTTNGSYEFQFTDNAGNTGSSTATVDWIDKTSPKVINVTSTDNGTHSGGNIDITVEFDEIVFVTGAPTITLNTTPTRTGNYLSGDGTTTLTFRYTIESGDTSNDLDYASTTALALNGGTIKDVATNDATLALASPGTIGSLGYNKDIVIDAKKPTCTFDYNPTSGTVVNTDVIATCTPSEPVTYQQPLGTGVYTFTTNGSYEFQFTDNAGNTGSSTATVYWIDKTAPVLTQVTAVPTPTNNTTPSYTFSSTETGTITYSGSCSSTTTSAISGENTITFNTLVEGTYSDCVIVVTDSAGNPSTGLQVSAFTIDTSVPSAPTVTCSNFTSNTTGNYAGEITCTGTDTSGPSPLTKVEVSMDDGATWIDNGTSLSTGFTPAEGTTKFKMKLYDTGGEGLPSSAYIIVKDTTAPTLTQVTAVPTPTNDTTPDYTFSSNEAGTITYVGSCSSSTTSAISGDNTITFNTLATGTYSDCTITVTDVAGNASTSLSVNTFTIDTTKPTCTFTYNPTSGTVVNTDVVATCTPSEPVTYQQPLGTGVYTFTTNGSYEFQFTDNAGNTGSSTATVDWIDKTAPVVTLNGSTTMTVTRGGTFTDPGASWEDNVDGTGTITTANSGTVDAGTVGTYILEYRHTDTAGNKSDTVTRTVTVRVKKVTSSKEEQLSTGQTEPEVLDDETSEKTLDELVGDYMEKYKDNPEKLKQLETAMKSAKDSDVDQELKDAYVYAFLNGITTQATIEKAELDRGITRAEMAKMMAVFATKISDKERVKTGIVKYADVDSSLGDLADYILLAYQLQIMGIDANGNPIENFNPHAEVTRAEFATVLSRILYGNKYNQQGSDFYSKHLQALKNASILKNTTPTMKELRGWVMLMLYRS
ncbi:MAG TPA: DUF5011 domain-containing protein [Candidatus Absconditabacterales bacterium]|nr:DUF5011 domain-containing protein [Candidatus Absconditabacterales bacterium]